MNEQPPGTKIYSEVPEVHKAFEKLRQCDSTVSLLLASGASLEAVIVALGDQKRRLIEQIAELDQIAPRKIVTPDGRVYIWRCPDELVPQR